MASHIYRSVRTKPRVAMVRGLTANDRDEPVVTSEGTRVDSVTDDEVRLRS